MPPRWRWFTATAHWGDPHILVMNDNGEARHGRPEDLLHSLRPTRENLDWALKQWLGHRLQPGDIGIVYFAGQSAVLDDREVLLPIDAEADDLAHTGWTPEEAVDELAPRKQASLCLWIDAASPLRELADGRPSTDQEPAVNLLLQLTRWPGVSAWMAHSRPDRRHRRSRAVPCSRWPADSAIVPITCSPASNSCNKTPPSRPLGSVSGAACRRFWPSGPMNYSPNINSNQLSCCNRGTPTP